MIKKLMFTEKSAALCENNCYTFLVDENTNKIEIKKFISKRYKVNVIKVNILKKLGKKVRRGRVSGTTQTYKKAYVFTDKKITDLEEVA